jgi:hypothetical protein
MILSNPERETTLKRWERHAKLQLAPAIDDKRDSLALREVIVAYQTYVVTWVCTMACLKLRDHDVRRLLTKHWQLPHVPEVPRGVLRLYMLYRWIPALRDKVDDLLPNLLWSHCRKVRECLIFGCGVIILKFSHSYQSFYEAWSWASRAAPCWFNKLTSKVPAD